MIAFLCLVVIFLVIVLYIYRWHDSRKDLYKFAKTLPGPTLLPIIGNALIFNCHQNEIFSRLVNITKAYPTPMKLWLGPELLTVFNNPSHVEKIITSSKMTYKHDIYRFLQVFLGDGLISGSGPKWKLHRKIIQPFFHQKYLAMNLNVLQNHVDILVKRLEKHVEKGTFDIHHQIHDCCMDFISEITFGEALGAQNGKNSKFIQSTVEMYDLIFNRVFKVWLQPEFLYQYTKHKTHEKQAKSVVEEYLRKVIEKSRKRLKSKNYEDDQPASYVDMIIESLQGSSETMSEKDLVHHILTLFAAGEDPMTITSAFACVAFGMYPEYQEKAAAEVRRVFGNSPRAVTLDDLKDLNYVEMCIKEVLRIMPVAPLIIRKPVEDFTFDEFTIPKGCAVFISIVNLHTDPTHWEHAQEFYPDHFKPEAVEKRHPYAYLPFSGGQRGCIGKLLAMASLKATVAALLQQYRFEADGKFQDIKLKSDISVRPIDGYNLKIFKRTWK